MIELHLTLKVPPRKVRALTEALQALAKSARAEPGCVRVDVYKTVGASPHILCYGETWESETGLRRMIASKHFSQLASLMELSNEPPDCQFRFISKTQGLEFAEQVRSSQPN